MKRGRKPQEEIHVQKKMKVTSRQRESGKTRDVRGSSAMILGVPVIPLEPPAEFVYDWPTIASSNPFDLNFEDIQGHELEKQNDSDWDVIPEDGFLELLDDQPGEIVFNGVGQDVPWRLIKIDIPVPTAMKVRVSRRQCCLDPRLA